MSDRSFTLLELHFHSDGDVQVGPRRVDAGLGGERERPERPRADGGTEGNGPPLPLVAGALGLGALAAVAAWRALRGR